MKANHCPRLPTGQARPAMHTTTAHIVSYRKPIDRKARAERQCNVGIEHRIRIDAVAAKKNYADNRQQ